MLDEQSMKPFGKLVMRGHTLLIVFLVLSVGCTEQEPTGEWTYHGEFHDAIADADMIVVRDGGFDCCHPVDGQKELLRVTDLDKIKEIAAHIEFQPSHVLGSCMCCGYPGIDWYKDGRRIALTSVQHGTALRWKGFPGDARFTPESAKWIASWLAEHGIDGPKQELELSELQAGVNREARGILERYVPDGYLDAIARAEKETQAAYPLCPSPSDYLVKEDELKSKYIRLLFKNEDEMYAALFRIMGCLPMRWYSQYMPEQNVANDIVSLAPRDELDRAIRAAAVSSDEAEQRGAARVVFTTDSSFKFGLRRPNDARY